MGIDEESVARLRHHRHDGVWGGGDGFGAGLAMAAWDSGRAWRAQTAPTARATKAATPTTAGDSPRCGDHGRDVRVT